MESETMATREGRMSQFKAKAQNLAECLCSELQKATGITPGKRVREDGETHIEIRLPQDRHVTLRIMMDIVEYVGPTGELKVSKKVGYRGHTSWFRPSKTGEINTERIIKGVVAVMEAAKASQEAKENQKRESDQNEQIKAQELGVMEIPAGVEISRCPQNGLYYINMKGGSFQGLQISEVKEAVAMLKQFRFRASYA